MKKSDLEKASERLAKISEETKFTPGGIIQGAANFNERSKEKIISSTSLSKL